MLKQERGIKPSNALCYNRNVDGSLDVKVNAFQFHLVARHFVFSDLVSGIPYIVFAPREQKSISDDFEMFRT